MCDLLTAKTGYACQMFYEVRNVCKNTEKSFWREL